MTAPKISVSIFTARGDHPYTNPDWHCFDPVVKTLAAQTFTDFELVLVDTLWDQRPDYFIKNPAPFPVKHVPSKPNYWQERGRPGLSAQINRGFVWADGELVWIGGEDNMFPPQHLERVWTAYKQTGKTPLAWYGICGAEKKDQPHPRCPAQFDLLGYTQYHVTDMDHRGFQFVDNPNLQIADCHHQNYFGYSSVPLEAALRINGFDELFDGQWGLFDCDFGSRLNLAGVEMILSRDIYVMEPPVVSAGVYGGGIIRVDAFKCHYAIYLHNRASGRKVNSGLPDGYIEDVKRVACYGQCAIKAKCASGDPTVGERLYYPFCEGKTAQIARDWFRDAPVRDLVADREARRKGEFPYHLGTITIPVKN